MQGVANNDAFPVEGHDHCACAKDWGEGVVAETHTDVCGVVVGDERRAVGEHVVGGTSAGDCQLL